ncbi:MAG: Ig-like domain repeat protein, partial [Chloroflexales bacterium]
MTFHPGSRRSFGLLIVAILLALTSLAGLLGASRTYAFPAETYIQGTALTFGGNTDEGTETLPIGFTFNYYGTDITDIYAGTNGYLSSDSRSYYQNSPIPDSGAPPNLIAPFWTDLQMEGGPVIYATTGTAPNRKLIVQWTNAHFFGGVLPQGTFQTILYETSNDIQFQYRYQVMQDDPSLGSQSTIGIQNVDGTAGVQYSYNTTAISGGQAIRFTPNGGTYDLNSSATYDGVVLGVGASASPSFPQQIAPANAAVTDSTTPTLSWDSAGSGVTYRVVVADNKGFNSPVIDVSTLTGTSYTPASGVLAYDTTYYWSVAASNADDTTWSEQQWSFVTPLPIVTPATLPFSESFKGASAANFLLKGSAALTGNGNIDSAGSGWLRLTAATVDQAGTALSTKTFDSANGIQATFTYATYDGDGADGLSFYLIDGATSHTTVGAKGGGLGYSSNSSGTPGVTGGYVGVGFDEYGGFADTGVGSCTPRCPGQSQDSVTIRGAGSLNTGFNYLTHASVPGRIGTTNREGSRTARITIVNRKITVEINSGAGFTTIINQFDLAAAGEPAPPATFRIGFSGSTGGSTNIHEIRDLSVAGILTPTTTSLASSANPSLYAQSVDFTATVAGSGGTPTGTVTFLDGAVSLGTGSLDEAGKATFSTSALTVGDHPITARYEGDDTFGISTSSTVSQVVASSNADLSALAISQGSLSEAFAAGITGYTADVANSVSSLTVTPTAAEAHATVTVNGAAVTSGSASGAISLSVGANPITVVVTAQDGTTTKT